MSCRISSVSIDVVLMLKPFPNDELDQATRLGTPVRMEGLEDAHWLVLIRQHPETTRG
jgi:hypothetical protein